MGRRSVGIIVCHNALQEAAAHAAVLNCDHLALFNTYTFKFSSKVKSRAGDHSHESSVKGNYNGFYVVVFGTRNPEVSSKMTLSISLIPWQFFYRPKALKSTFGSMAYVRIVEIDKLSASEPPLSFPKALLSMYGKQYPWLGLQVGANYFYKIGDHLLA